MEHRTKHLKISALLLALLLSQNLWATSGPYIGAGLLASVLSGNQSLHLRQTATGDLFIKNYALHDTSITGEFFGGYGIAWKNIYMGLELTWSPFKMKSELKTYLAGHEDEKLTTTIHSGYGAAARVGYKATENSLLYVRLGTEARTISCTFTDTEANAEDAFVPLSKKYRSYACVPGVGLETKISSKWMCRIEGKAAFYPNKHFKNQTNANNYTQIKTRTRIYSLSLGVEYTF